MLNWIRSFVFTLFIVVCGGDVFAQIGYIPLPPPPQQNPCAMLQQQVNIAAGSLNGWNAILAERRAQLTNAQARLAEVQSWRELLWDGVAEQTAPLSDGQIMAIGMINMAIVESQMHVAQMQAQVLQAEQQVNAWSNLLQQAQAAFNAAGC